MGGARAEWPANPSALARYEGSFKDNQMHGKGVYTDAQGVEWKGKFYNGVGPGLAAGTVVAK